MSFYPECKTTTHIITKNRKDSYITVMWTFSSNKYIFFNYRLNSQNVRVSLLSFFKKNCVVPQVTKMAAADY